MEKEHKLKTLGEVVEVVNEQNIDNFLIDFRGWLELNILKKPAVKMGIVKQEKEVVFHWIDDGKNDVKINIEIVNE